MSEESSKNPTGLSNNLAPTLTNSNLLSDANFSRNFLTNNNLSAFRKVILDTWYDRFITSWRSVYNEAVFRDILCPGKQKYFYIY